MSRGSREPLLAIEPYVSLGLEALEIGEERTRIAVPLAGNRNDKGTMFAGSIGAAMMLAGWRMCVAWAEARGLDAEGMVARDASVRYLRPVNGQLVAEARMSGAPVLTPQGSRAFDVAVEAADEDGRRCAVMSVAFRLRESGP